MQLRINKFLSDKKLCSRREADRLIEKGKVFVNGKKAKIGQKIDPSQDKVEIKNKKDILSRYKYYLYFKPRGIVSHKTRDTDTEAREAAGLNRDFAPVGRLDKASRGLILLTNDGRVVDRLLNPKYEHEKEYIVLVDKNLKMRDIKRLAKGVDIEGYRTKEAKAYKLSDRKLRIILKEGKKHQIRRMLAVLGYQVQDLKRVRIMNLNIKNLKEGQAKELNGKELKDFLSRIGL